MLGPSDGAVPVLRLDFIAAAGLERGSVHRGRRGEGHCQLVVSQHRPGYVKAQQPVRGREGGAVVKVVVVGAGVVLRKARGAGAEARGTARAARSPAGRVTVFSVVRVGVDEVVDPVAAERGVLVGRGGGAGRRDLVGRERSEPWGGRGCDDASPRAASPPEPVGAPPLLRVWRAAEAAASLAAVASPAFAGCCSVCVRRASGSFRRARTVSSSVRAVAVAALAGVASEGPPAVVRHPAEGDGA